MKLFHLKFSLSFVGSLSKAEKTDSALLRSGFFKLSKRFYTSYCLLFLFLILSIAGRKNRITDELKVQYVVGFFLFLFLL